MDHHPLQERQGTANDPKCEELGWVCVPMAVKTYGNWGKKDRSTINQLVSRLSIVSLPHKTRVIFEKLKAVPVRSNSRAIRARGWSFTKCNYLQICDYLYN